MLMYIFSCELFHIIVQILFLCSSVNFSVFLSGKVLNCSLVCVWFMFGFASPDFYFCSCVSPVLCCSHHFFVSFLFCFLIWVLLCFNEFCCEYSCLPCLKANQNNKKIKK